MFLTTSWLESTPYHNHFTALFPGPPPPPPQPFYGPFPGTPGWAGARRELLDLVMQGKINRGRQLVSWLEFNVPFQHKYGYIRDETEADTLTIRLGATPSGLTSLHHSPIFYRLDALPVAQPTASKHWRQLAHLYQGEDARVLLNGVTCTISVPTTSWLECTESKIQFFSRRQITFVQNDMRQQYLLVTTYLCSTLNEVMMAGNFFKTFPGS